MRQDLLKWAGGAAALGLLGACASAPKPAEPAPPPARPAPPMEEAAGDDYGDSRDLGSVDDLESLPPTGAGRPRRRSVTPGGDRAAAGALPNEIDYLPYIDVAIDRDVIEYENGDTLQDRYTRLRIVTLDPNAYDFDRVASGQPAANVDKRNYKDESRNWMSRMMGSRNVTRTLIAEFDISQPDITATTALFSATFSSDTKKGEVWSTNQAIAVYPTPYFKIGPSTTIEARVRMQLADERQNSAGASVMGALTQAANLIAPASTLVTYFNAPLMAEASNFLNMSTSTLLGQSITEQSTSSFSVKSWAEDSPILVLSAEMPDAGNIKDTQTANRMGRWEIYLDKPIPSVFSSTYQAEGVPDFERLTAGDVLGFQIGEDLTVYDYVFSRLELTDRIAQLNQNPTADTAILLCSRITRGLSEIGFTSYDAAAGIWAATQSDQFDADSRRVLQQMGVCDGMDLWLELKG